MVLHRVSLNLFAGHTAQNYPDMKSEIAIKIRAPLFVLWLVCAKRAMQIFPLDKAITRFDYVARERIAHMHIL